MHATNFRAIVNATGDRMHASDKDGMVSAMRPYASQEVIVSLESANPVTRGWRGYYFKVVVEAIRNKWTEQRGVPYSKDQVHHILKKHFIGVVDSPLGDIPKGTSDPDFTNDKFIDFIERVCAYAAEELDLPIPPPENRR
jgi:hypothetical protein